MKRTILIGCNYTAADGSDKRLEPGDVVDDLPASVASALEEMGALSPVEAAPPASDFVVTSISGTPGALERNDFKPFKTRGEREGQE